LLAGVWKLRKITKTIRGDAHFVYVKRVSKATELFRNWKLENGIFKQKMVNMKVEVVSKKTLR
jgi:hypothetical protein